MKRRILYRIFVLLAVLSAIAVCGMSCQPDKPTDPASQYEHLFEYDHNLPLNSVVTDLRKEAAGAQTYRVVFDSARGQSVPCLLVVPKIPEGGKAPCIILAHGLGGKKEDLKFLAGLFAMQGYATLTIDAPMHGERKKDAKSKYLFEYPNAARDAFIQQVIDYRRAVDYLLTRSDIDPKRIGFFGISMGAIVGTTFAGVDKRVQAPVLVVAGGNWDIIINQSSLKLMPDKLYNDKAFRASIPKIMEPVDPIIWAGRISPRPVFIIIGDADTSVPTDAGKALQNAAGNPKELLVYKGGHVMPPEKFLPITMKVLAWFDKRLKGLK